MRLHEESTNSLDIIRVGESEVTQCGSDQAAQEEKENREQPSSPLSSRRARLLPHRQATLHLQKQPKEVSKQRGGTPVFKIPKPLVHHHSTPAPTGDGNLFGFEELDSPLTLSPVSTTPAHSRLSLTQHSHEDCSRLAKPSPYSRLKGTYDIPLKHKTPKRQPGQRRVKRKVCSSLTVVQPHIAGYCVWRFTLPFSLQSDEDQWADKLNAQFTEIEEFELAVE